MIRSFPRGLPCDDDDEGLPQEEAYKDHDEPGQPGQGCGIPPFAHPSANRFGQEVGQKLELTAKVSLGCAWDPADNQSGGGHEQVHLNEPDQNKEWEIEWTG